MYCEILREFVDDASKFKRAAQRSWIHPEDSLIYIASDHAATLLSVPVPAVSTARLRELNASLYAALHSIEAFLSMLEQAGGEHNAEN